MPAKTRFPDAPVPVGHRPDMPGLVGAVVFLLLAAWILLQARTLSTMAAAFPLAVGAAMAALSLLQILRSWRGRVTTDLEGASDDATGRGAVLAMTMLL